MAKLYSRDLKSGRHYYASFYDADRSPAQKRLSLGTSNESTAREILVRWERLYRAGGADPWEGADAMKRAAMPERADAVTLSGAVEKFVESRRRRGLTESTAKTYAGILGRLARHVGESANLTALTASEIRGYIYADSVKLTTSKKRFRHIRAFLNWAEAQGLLGERQPLDRLEQPKVPKKKPVAVKPEELMKITRSMLRDYVRKFERNGVNRGDIIWRIPAFWFALLSGFRTSELARMRWKDVDLSAPSVHLRQQKNRREEHHKISAPAADLLRSIMPPELRADGPASDPLAPRLTSFLEKYHAEADREIETAFGNWNEAEGRFEQETREQTGAERVRRLWERLASTCRKAGAEKATPETFVFRSPGFTATGRDAPSFGRNLSRAFATYRDKAGVREQLSPHALRAGFCTMLARAGTPATIIKEAARHADITTTMKYVEPDDNHTQQALEMAFA